MGILICNGRKLYRKSSSLVRTPITITLSPDERAYYSVAGAYTSNHFPNSGFTESLTYANEKAVGHLMTQAALTPSSSYQIWRQVTSSHDPETVWYQGGYATGATAGYSQVQTEAYMQFCGYHFTVPQNLQSLEVTNVKVSFKNGGCIQCFGSPAARSASNRALKGLYDFTTFFPCFATSTNLVHLTTLGQRPYDALVDIMATTGKYTGFRDLWGFGVASRDGGIPALVSPVTMSYNMGTSTLNYFNTNKGCWIIPYIPVSHTSATSYFPYYWNNSAGYWACVSLWSLSIEVTLG